MATAAAQARLMSLTMYKSDLEFKLMNLSTQRQGITKLSADYAAAYAEMGGTESLEDDAYVVALQKQEEYLEQQQTQIETQLQECNAEFDSIEKLVETNIKKDFKLNFGS